MESIQSLQPNDQEPDRLPAINTLRQGSQWVCFDEKKVPYTPVVNPAAGKLKRASASNPESWGTFSQACQTLRSVAWLRGIGRQFRKDQGISGVDLDHCIDESGQLSAFSRMVVECLNSYTEYSPSGTGLHIWVYASLPANLGADSKADGPNRIEMKDSRGYFTVTGMHHLGTPTTIEVRQEELTTLYHDVRAARLAAKQYRVAPVTVSEQQTTVRETHYGQKALKDECSYLATTWPGGRHTQLFRSASRLGQLIAGGVLDRPTVERALYDACCQNGLINDKKEADIHRTLRDGIEAGMREPRTLPLLQPLSPQAAGNGNARQNGHTGTPEETPHSFNRTDYGNAERLRACPGRLLKRLDAFGRSLWRFQWPRPIF